MSDLRHLFGGSLGGLCGSINSGYLVTSKQQIDVPCLEDVRVDELHTFSIDLRSLCLFACVCSVWLRDRVCVATLNCTVPRLCPPRRGRKALTIFGSCCPLKASVSASLDFDVGSGTSPSPSLGISFTSQHHDQGQTHCKGNRSSHATPSNSHTGRHMYQTVIAASRRTVRTSVTI